MTITKIIAIFCFFSLAVYLNGQSVFSKSIDVDEHFDTGVAIRLSEDGYLLLAGSSCYSNSLGCYSYIKADFDGNVNWKRQLSNYPRSISPQDGYGNHGIATKANNDHLYYTGVKTNPNTGDDFFIMKTDLSGDSIWLKSYGGSLTEIASTVFYDTDSTLVLFGDQYIGAQNERVVLLKIDVDGYLIWQKSFGKDHSMVGRQDIIQLSNGDLVFTYLTCEFGVSCDFNDDKKLMLTKIDSVGNVIWEKEIYSFTDLWENSNLVPLDNGGFLVSFYRSNFDGGWFFPPILLWIDSIGEVVNSYLFPSDSESSIRDLTITSSGLVVGAGYIDKFSQGIGGWVFAMSQDGNRIWNREILDYRFPLKIMQFNAVEESEEGGFVLTGWIIDTIDISGSEETDGNIWLVKLDDQGCYHPDCAELEIISSNYDEFSENPDIVLYPNPANDKLYIEIINPSIYGEVKLKIWNTSWILILEEKIYDNYFELDIPDIPAGLYFVETIYPNGRVSNNKVFIE